MRPLRSALTNRATQASVPASAASVSRSPLGSVSSIASHHQRRSTPSASSGAAVCSSPTWVALSSTRPPSRSRPVRPSLFCAAHAYASAPWAAITPARTSCGISGGVPRGWRCFRGKSVVGWRQLYEFRASECVGVRCAEGCISGPRRQPERYGESGRVPGEEARGHAVRGASRGVGSRRAPAAVVARTRAMRARAAWWSPVASLRRPVR